MATINATATPAWRQFNFFQSSIVRNANDAGSTPDIFKNPGEITATASSQSGILVADIHGSIHVLNHAFETLSSWQAHAGGRVTHMIESKGILVTLGEEQSSRSPLLKIWDLEHRDMNTNFPTLLRSVRVQHGNKPHPVSTIALSSSLSYLAVGLGDGTVLLYRHLDQSVFSGSTSLTALPKPKVIHESPTEPITGLGFREPLVESHDKAEKENLFLFIVTTNRVLSYLAAGKGSGVPPTVVDEVGCGLGCAVMNHKAREMVIGRDEAIYMCKSDGRGACYAVEWPKILVSSFRNYLIIVSPPFFPSSTSTSATVRNFVSRAPNPAAASQTDVSKVTIFDLENKFIAFSESTFTEGVRDVICDTENIYILGNDGKLFRMEEKSTSQKLSLLYNKSQYLLAISLATSEGLEESDIAAIHRQYGDHLYLKGDYDGAIQQFIQTLGHVQPSYVIRKFLDAQRIQNLATYLQELHTRGLANSDHTTLLLNTYTKLGDVSRLDNFIKTESVKVRGKLQGDSKAELPFDLDTAIRVCRQAGYFSHAVYLAKKYERHEDYLRIQIEDVGNVSDALTYIRDLGPEVASANLVKYGRVLLSKAPEDTTKLLVEVCCGTTELSAPTEVASAVQKHERAASAVPYLSYLTYSRGAGTEPSNTDEVSSPPRSAEANRRDSADVRSLTINEDDDASSSGVLKAPVKAPLKRPSPSLYFAHFVDHSHHFINFLEAVAFNRWGQRVDSANVTRSSILPSAAVINSDERGDQISIWNTLLELYLTTSFELASQDKDASSGLQQKAIYVLSNEGTLPYDPTHALIVCSTHSFTEGLVLLWEKMGMYEDVLRFWMDKEQRAAEQTSDDSITAEDASKRVVQYLKLYGPTHPHLYPLVLRFLTSTSALLSRHTEDLSSILQHIETEKIISPMSVIKILSRNNVASVGLVKDWLMTRISESREEIDADHQLIDSYRSETKAKLLEISELSDPERPRVFHVTRCSSCRGQLDLPSVHFMCNHSYHQRCLGEHDTECPNCARDHALIREIRQDNQQFAEQQDLFLQSVENEGFSAIASAFSKGIIGAAV